MKMYETEYNWKTKGRFFSINKYDSIRFIYEPDDMTTYVVISNDGWVMRSCKYDISLVNLSKMGTLIVTPSIV